MRRLTVSVSLIWLVSVTLELFGVKNAPFGRNPENHRSNQDILLQILQIERINGGRGEVRESRGAICESASTLDDIVRKWLDFVLCRSFFQSSIVISSIHLIVFWNNVGLIDPIPVTYILPRIPQRFSERDSAYGTTSSRMNRRDRFLPFALVKFDSGFPLFCVTKTQNFKV